MVAISFTEKLGHRIACYDFLYSQRFNLGGDNRRDVHKNVHLI
jgi:hypothetical protein